MSQQSIHQGFPNPPWRDKFANADGTLVYSWSQWLKAVAAVLGTVNESRLIFPANFTTASATPVSTGFGLGPLQSQYTNSFSITANLQLQNNTANDAVYAKLWRSTIGIPAAGSAPAASDKELTVLGGPVAAANSSLFLNLNYPDKNLAPARYFYYLSLEASIGGTAKLFGDNTNFFTGGMNVDEWY